MPKMIGLQMNFGGMKVVDDGGMICLEDRTLVEHLNVAGDAQREGDFKRADEILRQVITDHPLAELPVEVLCPLTIRTLRVLSNYNIVTVADLVQCRLSDLRDWYNFGKASRSCLGERLRAFGLNLVEQHDHKWIKSSINRKSQPLDRLLVLPTFFFDQEGYSEDDIIQALSTIADTNNRVGTFGTALPRFSLAPGGQYGLNLICNRTDLDSMTVRRLVRDLVAKRLVNVSTPPDTFTISPSGLRLVQQVERQS